VEKEKAIKVIENNLNRLKTLSNDCANVGLNHISSRINEAQEYISASMYHITPNKELRQHDGHEND